MGKRAAREVVLHYRDKGMSRAKLKRAVRRHVRLLMVLDEDFAVRLLDETLRVR